MIVRPRAAEARLTQARMTKARMIKTRLLIDASITLALVACGTALLIRLDWV